MTLKKRKIQNQFKEGIQTFIQKIIKDIYVGRFPFCDVAGGQIGNPLFLQKGMPPSESCMVKRVCSNVYPMHTSRYAILI